MRIHVLAAAAVATLAAGAALGASRSSVILDPAGDARRGTAPYQDIVRGEVTNQANQFIFRMELAAPLPASPPPVAGAQGGSFWEVAGIDLDPDTFPRGYPFNQNQAFDLELLVVFVSDGTRYFAELWDRRPLLEGKEAVITPLDWRIDGNAIEIVAGAELLGDPPSFMWRDATLVLDSHLPGGHQVLDAGADDILVPWPD